MSNPSHKIIIIAAPSGAGKTSVVHHLLRSLPERLGFSVSCATRSPRANEKNGVDYYFISETSFQQKIQEQAFVEWEMVYKGKYYGTLKSELQRIWNQNQIPVLDIDVKGAIHVQQQYPQQTLSIFIQPPSIEVLAERLENRGTESPESIATRVSKAEYEISFNQNFNAIIVNDELKKACKEAEEVILAFLNM